MWNGTDAGSKHAWTSSRSLQGHHSPLLCEKSGKKKNQIHNTKSWMIINIYGNYIFPIEQPFAGVATSLFGPCMDIPGLFLNLSSCVYEILFK